MVANVVGAGANDRHSVLALRHGAGFARVAAVAAALIAATGWGRLRS